MLEYLDDCSINAETGFTYNYCNVRKGRLVVHNNEDNCCEFSHAFGDIYLVGISIDDPFYYTGSIWSYGVLVIARDGREYKKETLVTRLDPLPTRSLCASYSRYTKANNLEKSYPTVDEGYEG